ncbi:MAG TPA: DUF924 family protein [Polyangiaceae bacterium]|nr:DUF924 family protein [Polyangiaceae bacterium]
MTHRAMLMSAAASVSDRLGGHSSPPPSGSAEDAQAVVAFWKDAGPSLWFAKSAEFDRRFRERFATLHEAAARGDLDSWLSSAAGALALCLLLDQYPRNAFRGTKRMYATDEKCRSLARQAIRAGHDLEVEPALSLFFYLPFAHSEVLADQERSVALSQRLGAATIEHAEGHRDIIKRFGRFPHRNPILGRSMTQDEQRFLDEGGYAG